MPEKPLVIMKRSSVNWERWARADGRRDVFVRFFLDIPEGGGILWTVLQWGRAMHFQSKNYKCAPAAAANVMEAICDGGVSVEEMARLCHTSQWEGTNHKKLMRGIRKRGFRVKEIDSFYKKRALQSLFKFLSFTPVILCVDNDQHWIAALAKTGHPKTGERAIIFDSARTVSNKRKHGVHVLSASRLAARWVNDDGEYYGIVVFSKRKSG